MISVLRPAWIVVEHEVQDCHYSDRLEVEVPSELCIIILALMLLDEFFLCKTSLLADRINCIVDIALAKMLLIALDRKSVV